MVSRSFIMAATVVSLACVCRSAAQIHCPYLGYCATPGAAFQFTNVGGTGIYGQSNGQTGSGVVGWSSNPIGTGAGVIGSSSSATGFGIIARSNFGGVGLFGTSPSGVGVRASSSTGL